MTIPRGNTVAIAGDPGTGKTTLLLTFLRYARLDKHGFIALSKTSGSENGPTAGLFSSAAGSGGLS